ncbi:putative Disease resistance protein RGA2 [Cocos nucifera]|uniref:Putative Disease resistance protein RGA2 n=1 Tax=Cocos nucifera TaxID=13894 RepID=A0A8K0IVT4_COCNU|nr:putative Disease resistance protein RGA2 [Cocos nucifera]
MDSLRRLELSYWEICPQLPPLGKLPNLDYLRISNADAVKKIGTQFLGQESDRGRDEGGRIQISFPKSTKLEFIDMYNWEEWEWEVKDDDGLIALPNLKELTLSWCPKLRSLPSGLVHHATTLTKLQISHCDGLKEIRGFSSIKELQISHCDSLKEIRGFSSIKELRISDSRKLEGVSDLPTLETLALCDEKMRSLPEWFHGGLPDFPALHKLEIMANGKVLRGCLKNGLDWPKIEHIPYVHARSMQESGYISKSPSAFTTNLK